MPDDQKSDESLVDAHRKGDSTAFDVLLKRYEVALRNFILSFSWLVSPDTVDDIIQEIFITIFNGIKEGGDFTVKGGGAFKAWLYSIARHRCLNAVEQQPREKPIGKHYLESMPAKLEKIRYYDEPDEAAELEELKEGLNGILAKLSDEEKQLLILKEEGKTYPQIHKIPPFDKYSVVHLRRMVCDARNFVKEEMDKWEKKRKI